METNSRSVFKRGSTTFFTSSLFFDKKVMADVSILYAFVRVADDFVDSIPQKTEEYYAFKQAYVDARCGKLSGDSIIDNFVALQKRVGIENEWADGFFSSMEMDLRKREYQTLEDVYEYIYGSAEVIGFCMMRILGLPQESMGGAAKLGRAFQYINFLRDVNEDLGLGRQYIPKEIISKYFKDGLFDKQIAYENKQAFIELMRGELERYLSWQDEARNAFSFIPRRSRIAVATAADMYEYTAKIILHNPFIVFDKKVKPARTRIVIAAIKNIFTV